MFNLSIYIYFRILQVRYLVSKCLAYDDLQRYRPKEIGANNSTYTIARQFVLESLPFSDYKEMRRNFSKLPGFRVGRSHPDSIYQS